MAGRIIWTKLKLDRLRECWPVMSCIDLTVEFPGHSIESIRFASKRINLPGKYRNWRAIANAHKPRIVLARVVPGEVVG